MTDLDRLLDEASSDVRRSVRRKGSASPVTFRRKSHRRAFVLAVTSVLAVGATAILVTGDQRGLGPLQGSGTRITSEVILSDGVVSEAEYRAGADAVVSCLADIDEQYDLPLTAVNLWPLRGRPPRGRGPAVDLPGARVRRAGRAGGGSRAPRRVGRRPGADSP